MQNILLRAIFIAENNNTIGRFEKKFYFVNFRHSFVKLRLFLVADVVLGCGGDVAENGN